MTITNATTAPLVAVTGATGNQGSSVINNLTESPIAYRIRGFTRNTRSAAAKALADKGVETYQLDLTIRDGSKAEVTKGFQGADIVFAVTNFWDHQDTEREQAEGKQMADAARAADVKLFIWSGLPEVKNASGGKYTHIPHFDGKAAVFEHVKSLSFPSAVDVQCGFYAQNFLNLPPLKNADGSYTWAFANGGKTPEPFIDTVGDYGLFVRAVIEAKASERPEVVRTASEEIGIEDFVKIVGEAAGKQVSYNVLTRDQHFTGLKAAGIPEVMAEELVESFEFHDDPKVGYYVQKPVTTQAELPLGRKPITMKEWAKTQDWAKVFV